MRAKISRIGYWRGIPQNGPENAALAEARAILEETEPRGVYPGPCRQISDQRNVYSLNGFDASDAPWAALAEALARFIGD